MEVNVAGEESKGGVAPAELGAFIERCPVSVVGLMTMPPFSTDPEDSRPAFARLAELAAEHGLSRLSMGTSQDWEVAVGGGRDDHPAGHLALHLGPRLNRLLQHGFLRRRRVNPQ